MIYYVYAYITDNSKLHMEYNITYKTLLNNLQLDFKLDCDVIEQGDMVMIRTLLINLLNKHEVKVLEINEGTVEEIQFTYFIKDLINLLTN